MKKSANKKRKGISISDTARRFAALGIALWFALVLSQGLLTPLAAAPLATGDVAAPAPVAAAPAPVAAASPPLAPHGAYCHCKMCAGGAKCCCRPEATPQAEAILSAGCDEDAPVTLASVVVLPRSTPASSAGRFVAPVSVTISRRFFASPDRRASGRAVAPDPLPPPFFLLSA